MEKKIEALNAMGLWDGRGWLKIGNFAYCMVEDGNKFSVQVTDRDGNYIETLTIHKAWVRLCN